MKKAMLFGVVLALWGGTSGWAVDPDCDPNHPDAFPCGFPSVTARVYDTNALAEGRIFLAVAREVEGVGYYLMVLNNDGPLYAYKELRDDYTCDFKVQRNGLISYAQFTHHHSYTGGGHCIHVLLNQNLEVVEEIQIAKGHALLCGCYLSQVDMSQLILGETIPPNR